MTTGTIRAEKYVFSQKSTKAVIWELVDFDKNIEG